MSKMIIVEGNSNDKDNVRVLMVKGEKGEQGDLNHNDIVDNLTSTATNKVLSAKQGKVLKDLVDNNQTETNEAITNLRNTIPNEIKNMRKEYYNNYHLFNLPSAMDSFFNKIKIYESNDKQNYKYFIDEEALKNSGGSTVYVDNSNSSNGDGSENNPYRTLTLAFRNTNDGDTIKVKKGIYYRNDIPTTATEEKNNVNIICEENTIFTAADALTWTQNSTYNNIYEAPRSNAVAVIDYNDLINGIYSLFTRLADGDIEGVSNTKNSWCRSLDNTTVYVNNGGIVSNENTIVQLGLGSSSFTFQPTSKDMNIYIENAIFLNHIRSIVQVKNSANYDVTFVAKNCKFLFGVVDTTMNAVEILGASAIFINCSAILSQKDGFNYHRSNGRSKYAIEINCIGSNNGLNNDNYNNGSTIHDGYQILRINGTYFNNKGGNVTDVHENSLSVNINCSAFDSLSTVEGGSNSDFCVQQSGATMYLYNCFAKGKSYKNLYNTTGGTMYASNCNYDSLLNNGTFIDIT